ncbi:PaaX family transcriptional regulator C-terminal domain-containing protein [Paraburkholderia sp. A2WS-5]|uniref:PaaX family transcriptional regulator n=1 Tax=unclassified Paraburkholderia TaxID=2615204 RepID=UPI003B7EA0B5
MKASVAIDEIIAGREHWSHEQPTHHRYLLTFFGLYARPAGKAIPVAAVVRLMAELGSEPSSVRSSISRLKTKGVLVSKKAGAGSEYALSELLEPHMQAGDERIFSPRSMGIGDSWLLVSFSVPESERQNRHKIRAGLTRMGFGTVGAGLYIGPEHLQAEAAEYIREHQLWNYVQLFVGQPGGHGNLQEKVAQWWDLEGLREEYQVFVDSYRPESIKWQSWLRDGTGTAGDAFKLYIAMVTHWRRLPFLDPGLPPELLPADWVGIAARKVFTDLHRVLKPLSAQYFAQVIGEYA